MINPLHCKPNCYTPSICDADGVCWLHRIAHFDYNGEPIVRVRPGDLRMRFFGWFILGFIAGVCAVRFL